MDKNKTVSIKVIIIGESGVGKTSLVKKFVSGQFSKDYRSSIGTNIFTKIIDLNVEKAIAIQLWDIAGQERWTKMRHVYYRGARGVIIVGDVARKNTFKNIPNINFALSFVPRLNYNINENLILDFNTALILLTTDTDYLTITEFKESNISPISLKANLGIGYKF